MPYKIMVVDDEPANLRLLERLFRRDYQVITASSGAEALELLGRHDVAVLVSDQRMPGMTGIELLKRTAEFRPHMVRIILTGYTDTGALVEAINCGHVYKYVTKPWSNDDLRQTVERAVEHYEASKARSELEQSNQRLNLRLKEMTRGVVRAIADALEARDEHVYGHARRVSGYSSAIARRMRLNAETIEHISLAAFLHDIGKIGTPDSILLKPAALTAEERSLMQQHAERGARMLAGIPEMQDVADAIRYHHENFDGSGYPEGLRGEQIPIAARIIRVADVYDALTSPRPFRGALAHDVACMRLEELSGRELDPQIVRAFSGLTGISQIHRAIASGIFGGRLSAALGEDELSKAGLDGLACLAESEPVLAALVLREANEKSVRGPVAGLRAACELLGRARVLATTAEFYKLDRCMDEPERLQEHSVRCATAARLLAEQTRLLDPEEAYMLGLLHDAGKLLLLALFPDEMEDILRLEEAARSDWEVAAFGVDHGEVGHWILKACGVPRSLTVAVQTHHDAMRTNTPAALLLHLADAVASADDPHKVAALDAFGSDRLAMLKLRRADLAGIHARTAHAVENQMLNAC